MGCKKMKKVIIKKHLDSFLIELKEMWLELEDKKLRIKRILDKREIEYAKIKLRIHLIKKEVSMRMEK